MILFSGRFNTTEILSGPEKTARRIFEFHSKENETCFIEYFFDGRKYSIFKKLFGFEKVSGYENVYRLGLFRILSIVNKFKPVIVHLITYERFQFVFFILKIFKKFKIIYNAHGIIRYENYILKKVPGTIKKKDNLFEYICYKFSELILFYSEKSIEIASRYYKLNDKKYLIIANGIDEAFYKVKRTVKSKGINIVIYINSFEVKYKIEQLKKIFSNLSISFSLNIICEINLQKIIEKHGFKNIQYNDLKNQDNLTELFSNMDVILVMSKFETFSTITAEAMASGIIPLMSEDTGISRFIIDNENGFIINDLTSEKFVQVLNELYANNQKKQMISDEARKVYELLNWKEIYNSYINIYNSI